MLRPLARRVISWLVDLCVIAVPSALIALTQAEVFASRLPAPPGTGPPLFTTAQEARIDTLAELVSVRLTLGRSLFVWAEQGLLLTVASVALLALLMLCLLPANLSGATPGMRLTGFRVVTTGGGRAGLGHHLIRTVVGIVDLVPFVVPGLLGFVFAASPGHRRIGDRAAGTVVSEVRHLERRTTTEKQRRAESAPARKPATATDPPLQAELPLTAPSTSQGAPDFWSKPTPAPADATAAAPAALAEIVATASATAKASAALPAAPLPSPEPQPTPARPSAPGWSDDLDAWVVTDQETGRLFRHDTDIDRWIAVSR